jgi:hypothetical protein
MSDKIKVIKDLMSLKCKIKELKYKAIIVDGKKKKLPIDADYTRMLRILNKIVDNQIDQVNT